MGGKYREKQAEKLTNVPPSPWKLGREGMRT